MNASISMIDSAIIILFLVANLLIGFYGSKKIRTFSEYSVWQRSFGSFAICATLSASFIGGGYTMGNAAKVYSIGMIYAFGLLGFSLKEILVAWLIAPKMHQYSDCHSVGDIMGKHYGPTIKMITGVFSVLICMGILGAQVSAIGALFTIFFHMGPLLGILIGFGVMIAYAAAGGMRSIVYTDMLQFLVLLIGIPLTFFVGLHHIGGWHVIENTLPASKINPFLHLHNVWVLGGLVLTFIFGEILVPPYMQRLFMAKSTKQTQRATFWAGIISMPIFIIAGAVGLVALVMHPHLDPNLAIPYVIQHAVPIGIKGIVIASLLAVIMSSAAGFLNAAAIAFTSDIAMPFCKKREISALTLLRLARLVSIMVGIGAVVFALAISNILDILIYAYNLWAPIILVPLLAAMFGLKITPKHFYISGGLGLIATLIWSLGLHEPFQLTANVVGVAVSFVAFLCVYCLSQMGNQC